MTSEYMCSGRPRWPDGAAPCVSSNQGRRSCTPWVSLQRLGPLGLSQLQTQSVTQPRPARGDCAALLQALIEPKLADKRVEGIRKLKPLAERLKCTLAQLALAWCIANPHVSSVLTGASKLEQVSCPKLLVTWG